MRKKEIFQSSILILYIKILEKEKNELIESSRKKITEIKGEIMQLKIIGKNQWKKSVSLKKKSNQ